MATVSPEELLEYAGRTLIPSSWKTVTQDLIDGFADVTDDHQFIHVDLEKASRGPFGTTIAHGFLTLSLLSSLRPDDWPALEGMKMIINYGLDKVRFLKPVKVGSRVRVHTKILSVTERRTGQFLVRSEKTMEIEGDDKPAYIAVQLALLVGQETCPPDHDP